MCLRWSSSVSCDFPKHSLCLTLPDISSHHFAYACYCNWKRRKRKGECRIARERDKWYCSSIVQWRYVYKAKQKCIAVEVEHLTRWCSCCFFCSESEHTPSFMRCWLRLGFSVCAISTFRCTLFARVPPFRARILCIMREYSNVCVCVKANCIHWFVVCDIALSRK